MNQEQNEHMRMCLNTQSALDQNTSKWNTIPIMVTTKNELDELIQRIEVTNEKANPASVGVTAQKDTVRLGLAEKVLTVSGILQAYAALNDDAALAEKVKLTKSELLSCREADVEGKVSPVVKLARNKLADLADYTLTEDMLVETETSLDNFKALIGQPRNIRNQAFVAMGELDDLFDEVNALLKSKIDKLMIRFEFTDKPFYDEYIRARVIVN